MLESAWDSIIVCKGLNKNWENLQWMMIGQYLKILLCKFCGKDNLIGDGIWKQLKKKSDGDKKYPKYKRRKKIVCKMLSKYKVKKEMIN